MSDINDSEDVVVPPKRRRRMRTRPIRPPQDDMGEPMAATDPQLPPQPGDIVQILTKGHPFMARIGIVHHHEGPDLVCYQPGRNGQPSQYKVSVQDVAIVGKARLRYNKDLPEASVYADNQLDKI